MPESDSVGRPRTSSKTVDKAHFGASNDLQIIITRVREFADEIIGFIKEKGAEGATVEEIAELVFEPANIRQVRHVLNEIVTSGALRMEKVLRNQSKINVYFSPRKETEE